MEAPGPEPLGWPSADDLGGSSTEEKPKQQHLLPSCHPVANQMQMVIVHPFMGSVRHSVAKRGTVVFSWLVKLQDRDG